MALFIFIVDSKLAFSIAEVAFRSTTYAFSDKIANLLFQAILEEL